MPQIRPDATACGTSRLKLNQHLVDKLIDNLLAIVGPANVLSRPDELIVYECDGLPQHKHRPRAVVFPSSTEQTAAVMKELAKANVPFTPRGAGTGLSGGALALNQGVVIEMARMRRILKIDPINRIAVVQPGVVNLQVSRAVAPFGLYYVPDPSSQPTCTIGGNIAESAGGIHCLKYGTTTDHVLACRVVLAGGEVVELNGMAVGPRAYDLLGTFIGSEGTFGIATEATLKLVPIPPSVRTLLAEFMEVNDASHAVSAIIAAGVMPAALEMMDREIIRAVEASVFAAGLPPDAGAALLIELDGIEAGIDDEAAKVTSICMEYGARSCRHARDETERKKLWAARKGAFGAIGRISPDSMIQDAVVPRSRLPEVLDAAYQIAGKYGLRVANVFHAGDGNLHPLICFDSRFPDEVRRVKEAGGELMAACVAAGGTITGEHGVGLDKRELLPLVFSEQDMNAMLRVRAAFDPLGLCNPGKIIPMLRGCGEGRALSHDASAPAAGYSLPSRSSVPGPTDPSHDKTIDIFRAIANIVGDENTSSRGNSLVALPASSEEIAEVMKLSSREGWKVLPAGGMTWLNPDTSSSTSIIVSTARLDKVLDHEPADLIAITQAGVKLRQLNETLVQNGQWLPLDPPDDGRSTIGGVVATGLGGAQQCGYGKPRGTVIGMRVVLADGTAVKFGGRVVKNVAGYDLCKLFTGSYGTLGIITEINFKLRPRPASEATVIARGPVVELIRNARTILDQRLFPVAVEVVSFALANQLQITTAPLSSVLLLRFAGNKKAVAYQTQQSLSLIKGAEIIADDAYLWQSLASIPLQTKQMWRASVMPGDLERFIDTVRRVYDETFLGLAWQLGVADGRVVMFERNEEARQQNATKLLELRSATSNGKFVVIDAMDKSPAQESVIAGRIKHELDPGNVFC